MKAKRSEKRNLNAELAEMIENYIIAAYEIGHCHGMNAHIKAKGCKCTQMTIKNSRPEL